MLRGGLSGHWLLVITLLAVLLRVLRLDFQPLWWDEGYSLYFATNPLAEMVAQTARDIHPPLYYALLHGWIGLFGPSPVAVRLLSVAIGALTVPLAYAAGRFLGGSRVGLLAALLLAVNPLHIFYSQEVRMYGLVALLGLLSTLCALWLLLGDDRRGKGQEAESKRQEARSKRQEARSKKQEARGRSQEAGSKTQHETRNTKHETRKTSRLFLYGAYILSTTAALYTQYYAAFLPLAHTLFALWHWRRAPRRWLGWLGAQLLIGLAYLPWLLYAAPQLVPYVAQKVVKDADRPLGLLAYFARHLAAFAAGHGEGPLARCWWLGLLVLPLIAWGLWLRIADCGLRIADCTSQIANRQSPIANCHATDCQSTIFLLTTLFIPLAIGFALNLRYPFFPPRGERLLLLALPSFVLLAALALEGLWGRLRGVGWLALGLFLLLSALSLAGFYTVPRYADDDYRPLIARVQALARPDDVVFCVFPWQVGYFRAYAPAGPEVVRSPSPAWGEEVQEALELPLATGRHLWVPAHLALGGILEGAIEQHLLGSAYPVLNEWHGPNTRLLGFAAAEPQGEGPGGVDFGGQLRLIGSRWGPSSLSADNAMLAVELTWQRLADMGADVRVALRLADGQGRSWVRRDSMPQGGSFPFHLWPTGETVRDRHGLLVAPGTPPGDYELRLSVVGGEEGRALDVLDGRGQPQGTELVLGVVQVTMPASPLSPAQLPIEHRQHLDLDGSVRFLGHSGGEGPLAPGDLLSVSLFWQARRDVDEELIAFVQLLDGEERLAAGWEAPPGAGYPSSRWRAGDLLHTQAALRLPATLADGRYTLIAGLFRAADKTRLRAGRGDHITLAQVRVVGRAHNFTPPAPAYRLEANFADKALLVGYDLSVSSPIPHPLSPIILTLHWRAEALMDVPYTIFVHLLDGEGRFRGQDDRPPAGGALPTTGWLPGEYVADEHRLQISAEAAAGPHLLEVGLYDPATGERLPLLDEQGNVIGDRVLLEETPVVVGMQGM
ncbi:MAG: glycosyltransferase family 39 protein [Anaerolineae bacterium]|nr:glycosyltransferase family 39 protein [Anaerolineae bacterium]